MTSALIVIVIAVILALMCLSVVIAGIVALTCWIVSKVKKKRDAELAAQTVVMDI